MLVERAGLVAEAEILVGRVARHVVHGCAPLRRLHWYACVGRSAANVSSLAARCCQSRPNGRSRTCGAQRARSQRDRRRAAVDARTAGARTRERRADRGPPMARRAARRDHPGARLAQAVGRMNSTRTRSSASTKMRQSPAVARRRIARRPMSPLDERAATSGCIASAGAAIARAAGARPAVVGRRTGARRSPGTTRRSPRRATRDLARRHARSASRRSDTTQ